jgi:Ca2+-transporting ATPase
MATLHEHPKLERRMYVKGAPERILDRSTQVRRGEAAVAFDAAERENFEQKFIRLSQRGLRLLALAYKDVPERQQAIDDNDISGLTFVGFVGIMDPLRPSVHDTFEQTMQAGIRTVMITGDHRLTAQAIAREVGLPADNENILTGEELAALSQEELNARVERISVYARVSPEQKLNIIRAWQSHGKVVAMTGDGVNDSPALKAADIGIALGSGTDVAKQAADIVLLDDNYKTIVAAVEEGRGIFDNIRKVTLYLVSDSFSEVLLISFALLLGLPLPLAAAQILWINLVADGLPSVALTMEPKESEAMTEPPRSLREPVLNRQMVVLVAAISIATGIGYLGLFWYFLDRTGDLALARSVVFAALAIDSLPYAFAVRSLRHSLFSRRSFSNPWLLAAVAGAFLIQLFAFYFPPLQAVLGTVPLGWFEWVAVAGSAVAVIVLIEVIKYIFIVTQKRNPNHKPT